MSDQGAFGLVYTSVSMDAAAITPCIFLNLGVLVRVPDPKRGLEMKFRSTSPATFVFLL